MIRPVTKLVIRSDTPGLDRLLCPACWELPYNHPRGACDLNERQQQGATTVITHMVSPADVVFAALAFNDEVIVPDDLSLEEYEL